MDAKRATKSRLRNEAVAAERLSKGSKSGLMAPNDKMGGVWPVKKPVRCIYMYVPT